MEYEEREDEFDIASSFSRFFAFSHIQLTYHTWQEDEDEMAQRKKRIEDAEVDILGLDEVSDDSDVEKGKEVHDPDIHWAETDPDDDKKGWTMKVIMDIPEYYY